LTFVLVAAGLIGTALSPVASSKLAERRIQRRVVAMQLPSGATARYIPPWSFLINPGYEIRLRKFGAKHPTTFDETIYGVPNTGSPIVLYWRIPEARI